LLSRAPATLADDALRCAFLYDSSGLSGIATTLAKQGRYSRKVYPKYFGLKEASFSITPDPQYLFLSGQHREALAHLLYGAGDSGGFVLLTGEVGTGKTTVCRAFLEQLPQGVDVALVLNPALTGVELLHAICDEFGLDVPAAEQSAKALADRLNLFLLDAHARGRRPVLIIDEAQNLRPKVMEQIRLLTNLETTKQKLLQIFLIGQPELRGVLASPDLRQLNQRITARFHLKPLNVRETAAYVDHRIAVAGVDRPLFTAAALSRVHRYSGGVPRLINLLCDRALLGAAVSRRMQVTPDIVTRAAREVHGSDDGALPQRGRAVALGLSLLLAAAGGVWLGEANVVERVPKTMMAWAEQLQQGEEVAILTPDEELGAELDPKRDPMRVAEPEATEPELALLAKAPDSAANQGGPAAESSPTDDAEPEALAEPVTQAETDTEPDAVLAPAQVGVDAALLELGPPELPFLPESQSEQPLPRISLARSAPIMQEIDADGLSDLVLPDNGTVDQLLRLWGVTTDAVVSGLDCPAVAAFGLDCVRRQGRWSDLRLFDRPAALQLTLADGRSGSVVVSEIDDEHATLDHDGQAVRVPIALLDERWSGDYLILWRPPPFNGTVIGRGSGADAVAWLRERIAKLPGAGIDAKPARYDAELSEAVKRFQSEQGLSVDGVAGPNTLILLNNVLSSAGVPRLTQAQ